jgi:tellurite resistance protein TehA-like permease
VFITAIVLLMIGTHMIPLWFAVVVDRARRHHFRGRHAT